MCKFDSNHNCNWHFCGLNELRGHQELRYFWNNYHFKTLLKYQLHFLSDFQEIWSKLWIKFNRLSRLLLSVMILIANDGYLWYRWEIISWKKSNTYSFLYCHKINCKLNKVPDKYSYLPNKRVYTPYSILVHLPPCMILFVPTRLLIFEKRFPVCIKCILNLFLACTIIKLFSIFPPYTIV